MLASLRKLFGRTGSDETIDEEHPSAARANSLGTPTVIYRQEDDQSYFGNQDVLRGLRFNATLQIRTPLSVLQHHGELFEGPPGAAPRYGAMADGFWVPEPKTWAELGFDLAEGRESTHASDVGPVSPSDYLPFLIDFRTIVESVAVVPEKIARLNTLRSKSAAYRDLWQRLEAAYPEFPDSFFYHEFTKITGVGQKTARALYVAGFQCLSDLAAVEGAQLQRIPGVGAKTAKGIVEFCKDVVDTGESGGSG